MKSEPSDPFSLPAKKSLGQHFLTSNVVPKWLCDAAELNVERPVLEIGPGTGVLTAELLARQVPVIALETDHRSVAVLEERFAAEIKTGQLSIVSSDMRHGIPEHPALRDHHYQVVANIPYYLTGFILRTFLESVQQPTRMTLLVQKEVAERLTRDRKQSLLKIGVTAFGTPHYVRTVSRGHFTPPPRVESAIIDIRDITHERVPIGERTAFFTLVRAGFAHRRKQLLGNLRPLYPKLYLTTMFTTLDLPLTVRAEDLSLDQWRRLVTALTTHSAN